jgi:hypothetical protein
MLVQGDDSRSQEEHLGSLAMQYPHLYFQVVDPMELFNSLDWSTDLRSDYGDTMADFLELLLRKFENCTDWFLTDLALCGIQEPVVVIIRSDGRWQMDEGHHRLAWAMHNHYPVPVVFDDTGADDDSEVGYLRARVNVEAYHFTQQGEHLIEVDLEVILPLCEDNV